MATVLDQPTRFLFFTGKGLEPYAWVINASLAAAGSADPCLQQRISVELTQLEAVRSRHATRLAIVPWLTEEPIGPARLLALARSESGEPPAAPASTSRAQAPGHRETPRRCS